MPIGRVKGNSLSTNQVAEILNVNRDTVRRWADAGLIPARRVGVRRDRIFNIKDVNLFLSQADREKSDS